MGNLNKRPYKMGEPEHTESNQQEVSRKFAHGMTEGDINEETKSQEWKTTWLYSQTERLVIDSGGSFYPQDAPTDYKDHLLLYVPFTCRVEEAVLYTTASGVRETGTAFGTSHYYTFHLINKKRDDNRLTTVGYSCNHEPFLPNSGMPLRGKYTHDLREGDIIAIEGGSTGTPYPTSSGTWQYMLKVTRL